MIVQQELLKKIKDFGLNSYEAKIWTALLSRGVSSAGELSDISNVPRSRTYDVLESLEKKGFVMMKLGKPIKYMAISPTEVIDVIKKKIRQESIRQELTMDDLKKSDVLDQLTQLHTNGIEMVEPTDLVGMVKNRDNIYDYLESMIKKAEKSFKDQSYDNLPPDTTMCVKAKDPKYEKLADLVVKFLYSTDHEGTRGG